MIASGTHLQADVSLFIYAIENHAVFGRVCERILIRSKARDLSISASELVIAEALVAPLRSNDELLVRKYGELFGASWLTLEPITRSILQRAAWLRSHRPGLKTPDAIHIASMRDDGTDLLITNDKQLKNMLGDRALLIADLTTSTS